MTTHRRQHMTSRRRHALSFLLICACVGLAISISIAVSHDLQVRKEAVTEAKAQSDIAESALSDAQSVMHDASNKEYMVFSKTKSSSDTANQAIGEAEVANSMASKAQARADEIYEKAMEVQAKAEAAPDYEGKSEAKGWALISLNAANRARNNANCANQYATEAMSKSTLTAGKVPFVQIAYQETKMLLNDANVELKSTMEAQNRAQNKANEAANASDTSVAQSKAAEAATYSAETKERASAVIDKASMGQNVYGDVVKTSSSINQLASDVTNAKYKVQQHYNETLDAIDDAESAIQSSLDAIEQAEEQEAAAKEAEKQAELEAEQARAVYDVPSSGDVLTPSGGVCYYNGHKETYYSERVLSGGALDIPGRYTDSNGLVRDADGYICVATDWSYIPKYSIVETSLGTAKVYDTGCPYGVVDIYTNW